LRAVSVTSARPRNNSMQFISAAGFRAIALALSLLLPSFALAADERPAVFVKTPYVEITVTIAKELEAYPPLHATLLAEAKAWAERTRRETYAAWVADKPSFQGRSWTFERGYRLRVAVAPYVSVIYETGTYTGGAHPNSRTSTILWDSVQNRRTEIQSLFRESAKNGPTANALCKLVRDAIVVEKKKKDAPVEDDPAVDEWLKPIKPDFKSLGESSLAPSTVAGRSSGMTFHFSPYDVGSYAEGPYTGFVPFAALEPYLGDEAKKIFAGDRPKSDEEE
jgi:hypothetical protein